MVSITMLHSVLALNHKPMRPIDILDYMKWSDDPATQREITELALNSNSISIRRQSDDQGDTEIYLTYHVGQNHSH